MAFFTGNIRSKELVMDTQLFVILPQDGKFYRKTQKPTKTLILLHGLSDNAASWVRYTALERYAERYNLVVAMPEVQRSLYLNMKFGLKYESYIAQELPEILEDLFHISVAREDMMIAGLSMGGYGALRCALKYPEKYFGCASFSGALMQLNAMQSAKPTNADADLRAAIGPELIYPEDFSIFDLFDQAIKNGNLPRIFMTCGTEDSLFPQNNAFAEKLGKLPIDFTFRSWPGIHEWGVWDKSIEMMLRHFLGEPMAK